MIKKVGTIGTNILYTIVVLLVLAMALLFVGTKIDVLGYEVKVVQSGSMEPSIKTGGIVVISASNYYNVGDVVTYGRNTRSQVPVTHRIIEKTGEGKNAAYVTKGDANEDKDPRAITGGDIIGKVNFTIPYLGYVIQFARTPLGFVMLIGIPAFIIVLDELANIIWEVRVYLARKKKAAEKGVRRHSQKVVRAKEKAVKRVEHFRGRTPHLGLEKSIDQYDLRVKPFKHTS